MAVYLNDMFIDSYRGIRKLKIQDLGDINILVGDNNAEKQVCWSAFNCWGHQVYIIWYRLQGKGNSIQDRLDMG